MAVPTFDVSDIKPKTTTFKNGKLSIDGSNIGMKYEGILNETTQYNRRELILKVAFYLL